jgi:hypothetical protein
MLPLVRQMTLRLSDEARAGWDRACGMAGVTLTALVEAIGLELHRTGGKALGDRGPDLVEAAKAIDLERRRRR